jgi:Amt family ammonium transporter
MTIMNTIISGSVSSLVVFYLYPYFMQERDRFSSYNPVNICNGLLAGLVSITASCNNVENYSAFAIGAVGGLIFIFACRVLVLLKIDDPCSASQIHGICGAWGVIALGFFDRHGGLIYTGSFRQLGIQCIGALSLTLWTVAMTLPYFYLLNKIQRLRVSPLYEIIGLDILMHEEKEKLSHISQQTLEVLEGQRRAQAVF